MNNFSFLSILYKTLSITSKGKIRGKLVRISIKKRRKSLLDGAAEQLKTVLCVPTTHCQNCVTTGQSFPANEQTCYMFE